MYTDGLTEANKNVQDLFGATRMLNAPQFDDMTMLALEYK
jgi:serine phosphatase RsbU (regulator of sigma subunit)